MGRIDRVFPRAALACALLSTLAGTGCRDGNAITAGVALGEPGDDRALEEALADPAVAAAALGVARRVVYGEDGPGDAALATLEELPGRRAFLCAYRERPRRRCSTGVGEDLAASVEAAAAALREDLGDDVGPEAAAGIRLKLDVVTEAETRAFDEEYDDPRAREVATYGYVVGTEDGDISFLLPSELLERGLHHKKKGFSRAKIARALRKRNGAVGPLSGAFGYAAIRTISWVERDQPGRRPPDVFRLYRLHPYETAEPTPAELLQRQVWAADYLMSSIDADGRIRYRYRTARDQDSSSYNLLRHAGTTYALLQVADRTRFAPYLRASERAMDYLFAHCDRDRRTGPHLPAEHPRFGDSMYVVSPPTDEAPRGVVKLGGAGLALVMIDQYVETTGDAETYLEEARALGRFLVASQRDDGEFIAFPPRAPGGPVTSTDDSPYYPGEAIVGLARLYSWDRDPLWLETAVRGADWLIDVRDRGKDAGSLSNDHWLMLGLSYLYDDTQDRRYLDHSLALCRAVEHQYLKNEPRWEDYPDYRGGYYDPPRSTPAATRGEGLGAVLETCRLAGEDCGWIEDLLLETVRHEMLSQIDPDMSFWMPNPAVAFGGFTGGLLDMDIRNDFVQHNMSSLLGLERHLLRRQGVEVPGGPGWMERRLAGLEFPGLGADELSRLRADTLRFRGPTRWEEPRASE